jgi:hypothetical protein
LRSTTPSSGESARVYSGEALSPSGWDCPVGAGDGDPDPQRADAPRLSHGGAGEHRSHQAPCGAAQALPPGL